MKCRCYNKNHVAYEHYGGRGIVICDEWLNYQSFARWAKENGYDEALSIDRIDVNESYSPDNCRWATPLAQANNKRNNHKLDFCGKSLTVREWGRETGISDATIRERLKRGWSVEDALTIPVLKMNQEYSCDGKTMTLPQWADYKGMKVSTLRFRLNNGWTIEDALNIPVNGEARSRSSE